MINKSDMDASSDQALVFGAETEGKIPAEGNYKLKESELAAGAEMD